jgi:lipoate-protein ligase A
MTVYKKSENTVFFEYEKYSPEYNMAEDARLLKLSGDSGKNYFRIYGWNVPCISYGNFQKLKNINLKGYPAVKRITGGKAVFHYNDLNVSASVYRDKKNINPMTSYSVITDIINSALNLSEVNSEISMLKQKTDMKNDMCFCYSYSHEIIFKDRKLAGIAQKISDNSVLIQCSFHIDIDYEEYASIFNVSSEIIKQKFCSLKYANPDFDIDVFQKKFIDCLKNNNFF